MYQLLHKHPPVLLKNTLKYCPVSQNDYTELHYTITQKHTSQASHKHTWATSINFLGPAALWKEKDKEEHKISPGSIYIFPCITRITHYPRWPLQYHVSQCANVLPTRIHNYDTQLRVTPAYNQVSGWSQSGSIWHLSSHPALALAKVWHTE